MALPMKHRKSGEGAIASYDWTDIAEGVGYRTFYGVFNLSGSTGLLVNSRSVYSGTYNGYHTVSDPLTTSYVKVISKDFATTFNLPKIVKGKVLINAGHLLGLEGTSGGSVSVYDNVTIYKNNVSIGTMSGSEIIATTGIGLATSGMSSVIVDIPKTHFKKNDELKVLVDVYAKKTGTQLATTSLGHDPIGRDPDSTYARASTTLFINVPFVIDL